MADVLQVLIPGTAVVVGASGGPDSGGLLMLLRAARPDLVVTAVHVRHRLRADDRADVAAAKAQAHDLGAGFEVRAVEVANLGEGIEAAARHARHMILQLVASQVGAEAVLLGHTLDDQAETVLLRLARGTTLRGAAAMRPWRAQADGVPVGHPLLHLRRDEVHALVHSAGLPTVHDPSNDDPTFARNRVRSEVLPALGQHGADPAAALARFARRAAEDDEHLRAQALEIVEVRATEVVAGQGASRSVAWTIPPESLYRGPPAVTRRIVEELLLRVRPEVGAVADEIDDVLALGRDRCVDRRGVRVTRHGLAVRFERSDVAGAPG